MNENDNNFSDLKHLLKLKRHEIPPPGYFHTFSDQVIARISAGEARSSGSLIGQLNERAPWLANFLRVFEAKPGVIGGFATSLCLVLLFGVVLAERSETGSPDLLTTASSQSGPTVATSSLASLPTSSDFATAAASSGGIAISTNSSLQPVTALFSQSAGVPSLFQQASFGDAH